MSLLEQLQALKPKLPETTFYVPEFGKTITLRGFTVREGRALRERLEAEGKANPEKADIAAIHALAQSVVALEGKEDKNNPRPLANPQGVELIESLSEKTVRAMMVAYNRVTLIGVTDIEGNSGPREGEDGSSSSSRSPSDEPSMSSNGASARSN
jgi:hypothetical protein